MLSLTVDRSRKSSLSICRSHHAKRCRTLQKVAAIAYLTKMSSV
jgi:hypothetical protein